MFPSSRLLKLSKQQDVDLDSDLNSATPSGGEEDLFSVKQALCIAEGKAPKFEGEQDAEEKQSLMGNGQAEHIAESVDRESQDYSELKYGTEQAMNAIQTAKLTKAYNEQGHFAVRQAFSKLFGFLMSSSSQRYLVGLLYIMAVVVLCINCAIIFFWTQYESPKTTLATLYTLGESSNTNTLK